MTAAAVDVEDSPTTAAASPAALLAMAAVVPATICVKEPITAAGVDVSATAGAVTSDATAAADVATTAAADVPSAIRVKDPTTWAAPDVVACGA